MARPIKTNLDYFALDCHLDDKFRLIQAEFGLKGFAVVVKLFQKIYGEFGYYCEWNEDVLLLFMSENGVSGDNKNLIQNIVSACIRRNLFSEELFNKYSILTSAGIQRRYVTALDRRERVDMKKEYLLLSDDEITKNVYINSIYVDRNPVNVDRNTQSKVKESKVNKTNNISDSAEPETSPPKKSKPVKHKYGEYKNVLLTDEELEKLKTEYTDYADRIERLSSYVASTGKSYKSHYATIRNWARKDAEKPGRKEIVPSWMNKRGNERDYDFNELEKDLLQYR